jgi:hypothetical protein
VFVVGALHASVAVPVVVPPLPVPPPVPPPLVPPSPLAGVLTAGEDDTLVPPPQPANANIDNKNKDRQSTEKNFTVFIDASFV